VRDGRGRVRGERARIAERVRALLADGPATGPGRADDAAPSGHPGRAPQRVPWLPGDDFTVAAPSLAPRPAAVPAPESAPSERAPSARLGARLAARLPARLPARIDPGRRGAIAVAATAVVAAVVTGVWVFSSRPHSVRVTATGGGGAAMASVHSQPAPGPPRSAGPSAAPSSAVALVIDVAGKVRHPGLYRLPAGSRIDDAVQAAGGALPGVDLTALNLAAKVTDGQQIAVGMPGAAPAAGAGSAGSTPTSAPVDLNSATLDQLETLPGVGPVLGQHILDWRAAHGPFVTIDQLREVSGIGDVKFAGLRGRVTV
jgi:competence protein ComEA